MSTLRLAWISFIRRRWSLLYIVAPTTVLFALVTMLVGVETALRWTQTDDFDRRVFRVGAWAQKASFSRAELKRIERLPHVESMGFMTEGGCSTKENQHQSSVCDATTSSYIKIWRDQTIVSPQQFEKWERIRNGIIVTLPTAERMNWKEGQSVTLPLWPEYKEKGLKDPEFVISAVVNNRMGDFEPIYVHPDYVESYLNKPLTSWATWILADSVEARELVMQQLRTEFPGRPFVYWKMEETKSMIYGGAALAISVIRGTGLLAVFLVIVVMLTFISLSIDERRLELATLRAIGFERGDLFRMIVAESLLLAAPGVLWGCLIPFLLFRYGLHVIAFNVVVSWDVCLISAAFGLLLGTALSLIPALRASYANPLNALRGA